MAYQLLVWFICKHLIIITTTLNIPLYFLNWIFKNFSIIICMHTYMILLLFNTNDFQTRPTLSIDRTLTGTTLWARMNLGVIAMKVRLHTSQNWFVWFICLMSYQVIMCYLMQKFDSLYMFDYNYNSLFNIPWQSFFAHIIWLLTGSLAKWVECLPIVWEIWVQSQVASYQSLLKWYLIPPSLTLSNIRYVSRVKWSNPGKGVVPSPTPWCSCYWKREPSGHLRLQSPTTLLL